MSNSKIEELQDQISKLAKKIEVESDYLPACNPVSRKDSRPYILYENGKYHYVVDERGREKSRQTTEDKNLLLYWVFEPITSQMASYWELENRTDTSLSGASKRAHTRKTRQQELMAILDESWGQKVKEKLDL